MANNEDPRSAALAAEGQEMLGDKLMPKIVEAAKRACQAQGIHEAALMDAAMRRGFSVIEAAGIDQLDREASDGSKASANLRNEWRDHRYPESRGARWRRGQR